MLIDNSFSIIYDMLNLNGLMSIFGQICTSLVGKIITIILPTSNMRDCPKNRHQSIG